MLLIVTAVILCLNHQAGIPWIWYLLALATTILSPIVFWQTGVLFLYDPKWYVVYDKIFDVGQILIEITPEGFPFIGRAAISIGSLLYQAQILIKRLLGFAVVYLVLYTTSPSEVVNVLAAAGFPSPVMFIIMAFLRFCVMIQRKVLRIVDAQKLRGVTTTSRNPFKIVKEAFPLIFPMTRLLIELSDEVTKSCEMRAFGVRRVSPYKSVTMNTTDKLLSVITIIIAAFMVYGVFYHNIGKL